MPEGTVTMKLHPTDTAMLLSIVDEDGTKNASGSGGLTVVPDETVDRGHITIESDTPGVATYTNRDLFSADPWTFGILVLGYVRAKDEDSLRAVTGPESSELVDAFLAQQSDDKPELTNEQIIAGAKRVSDLLNMVLALGINPSDLVSDDDPFADADPDSLVS